MCPRLCWGRDLCVDACVSVCAFVTQVCLCVEVSLGVCVGLCLSIELSMYQSTCLSLHGLRDVFVLSEFPPQLSHSVCVYFCVSVSFPASGCVSM